MELPIECVSSGQLALNQRPIRHYNAQMQMFSIRLQEAQKLARVNREQTQVVRDTTSATQRFRVNFKVNRLMFFGVEGGAPVHLNCYSITTTHETQCMSTLHLTIVITVMEIIQWNSTAELMNFES